MINNLDETASGAIANGIETNTLKNAVAPYTDRIQMTPSSWLLYNSSNTAATTNDFNVEFIRSGDWLAKGTLVKRSMLTLLCEQIVGWNGNALCYVDD